MTIIDKNALNEPYSSIDYVVYNPLLSHADKVAEVARILSNVPVEPWPLEGEEPPLGSDARKKHIANYLGQITLKQHVDVTCLHTFGMALLAHAVGASNPIRSQAKDTGETFRTWQEAWATLTDESLALRPLTNWGVINRYRQHLFYHELKAGPLEIVQTLAPNERLEVVFTETNEKSIEEVLEETNELSKQSDVEVKDQTELTDRIVSSLARTTTTNFSAGGNANWISGSAEADYSETVSNSSNTSAEKTIRRVQEVTRKQSELSKRTFKISTKLIETQSTTSTTRHVIENKSNASVNYGLRRLYYEVTSKLQDLGPQLVWQSVINNPGAQAAKFEFVDDPRLDSLPNLPAPFTATLSLEAIVPASKDNYARVFTFNLSPYILGRLSDAQKTELSSSPTSIIEVKFDEIRVFSLHHFSLEIKEHIGFTHSSTTLTPELLLHMSGQVYERSDYPQKAKVNVTIIVHPTKAELHAAQTEIAKVTRAKIVAYVQMLHDKLPFKTTRRELEFEERKILLGMTIAKLVNRGPSALPDPADSSSSGVATDTDTDLRALWQSLSEVFDLEHFFYETDFTEWHLATRMQGGSAARYPYQFHSKQNQAPPVGSSIGWTTQPGADLKRNIFLNTPFARVCIPVKPSKERQAVQLLELLGVIPKNDPATTHVVAEMERFRKAEKALNESDKLVERVVRRSDPPEANVRPWLNDISSQLPEQFRYLDVYPVRTEQQIFSAIKGFIADEIVVAPGTSWGDHGKTSNQTDCKNKSWWNFLWS